MGAHRFKDVISTRDICRTPEAVYITSIDQDRIRLDIDLPLPMLIPSDEKDLIQNLHLAILLVIEKLYRERWYLLAGKTLKTDPNPMPNRWEDL